MKTLFIAWEYPDLQKLITVARLSRKDNKYILCYTRGALEVGYFVPGGPFAGKESIYVSDELLPFFENRILNRKRPEFKDFLRWLDLDYSSYDPLVILILTEGERATDRFKIFPLPEIKTDGSFNLKFFINEINNTNYEEIFSHLHLDDPLSLRLKPQAKIEKNTIFLETKDSKILIGSLPTYLCQYFSQIFKNNKASNLQIIVTKINTDTRFSYKFLCSLSARFNLDDIPFKYEEFKPIAKEIKQFKLSADDFWIS